MLRKVLSLTLLLLVSGMIDLASAKARQNDADQKRSAVKIKQKLSKVGVQGFITAKLKDGRKISGNIEQIGEDDFVLLTAKEGRVNITYSQVERIKDETKHYAGVNFGPVLLVFGAVILLVKLIH